MSGLSSVSLYVLYVHCVLGFRTPSTNTQTILGRGGGSVPTVTPSSSVGSSAMRKGGRVTLSYCAGNIMVSFSSPHTAQRSRLSLYTQRCQTCSKVIWSSGDEMVAFCIKHVWHRLFPR